MFFCIETTSVFCQKVKAVFIEPKYLFLVNFMGAKSTNLLFIRALMKVRFGKK
jgi:hypothetical protein